jgi:CRP-like cAMP-binding protein
MKQSQHLWSPSAFSKLDDLARAELARVSHRRRFCAGDVLFREGEIGRELYLIVEGHVAIQVTRGGDEPRHLSTRGPGEFAGEMAVLDEEPRMADGVALEDGEALVTTREDLLDFLERSPRAAMAIIAGLAERLRQAAVHLEGLHHMDVMGRVAAAILDLASGASSAQSTSPDGIRIRVTQESLAMRVAATRETVNRSLRELSAIGAIRTGNRAIEILDKSKLFECCKG